MFCFLLCSYLLHPFVCRLAKNLDLIEPMDVEEIILGWLFSPIIVSWLLLQIVFRCLAMPVRLPENVFRGIDKFIKVCYELTKRNS